MLMPVPLVMVVASAVEPEAGQFFVVADVLVSCPAEKLNVTVEPLGMPEQVYCQ